MKILLLCGGEGTRLYPLTKKIPKPLVKIKNKTIVDHIIAHLCKYNLNEYLICSGYKSAMVEEHFNNIKSIKTEIVNSGINLSFWSRTPATSVNIIILEAFIAAEIEPAAVSAFILYVKPSVPIPTGAITGIIFSLIKA